MTLAELNEILAMFGIPAASSVAAANEVIGNIESLMSPPHNFTLEDVRALGSTGDVKAAGRGTYDDELVQGVGSAAAVQDALIAARIAAGVGPAPDVPTQEPKPPLPTIMPGSPESYGEVRGEKNVPSLAETQAAIDALVEQDLEERRGQRGDYTFDEASGVYTFANKTQGKYTRFGTFVPVYEDDKFDATEVDRILADTTLSSVAKEAALLALGVPAPTARRWVEGDPAPAAPAPRAPSTFNLPSGALGVIQPDGSFTNFDGTALTTKDAAALPERFSVGGEVVERQDDGTFKTIFTPTGFIDPTTAAAADVTAAEVAAGVAATAATAESDRAKDTAALLAAGNIGLANIAETGATGRTTITQQEANRRASLEAGVRGFETAAGFIPTPLEQATFERETLRSPADFAYRAATQRGEPSPFAQVTQADVINQFRDLTGGFRSALEGSSPLAPLAPAVSTPATVVSPSATAAGAPPLPTARGGGIFGEPVEVHDNEVVTPIAGGGFAVIPMKTGDKKPRKSAQEGGVFGFKGLFDVPGVSMSPNLTQEQIRGFARDFSPPAVRDVFGGQRPSPLRFPIPGFQLPSPQMLGSLAPEERTAFDTRIGIEGFDPRTVEHSIRQRFGGTRSQPKARLAPRSGF